MADDIFAVGTNARGIGNIRLVILEAVDGRQAVDPDSGDHQRAGLFYYLRIVVALYAAPPEPAPVQVVSRGSALVLAVLAILLIWFGVYPTPLLNLIRTTVAGFNFATRVGPR